MLKDKQNRAICSRADISAFTPRNAPCFSVQTHKTRTHMRMVQNERCQSRKDRPSLPSASNSYPSMRTQILSTSFAPSRVATAVKVSLITSFAIFGNLLVTSISLEPYYTSGNLTYCFFKTSIKPALERLFPATACLNSGRSSGEIIFSGFAGLPFCSTASRLTASVGCPKL